jgi:hypothetical protein
MTLQINLTPEEEAMLRQQAAAHGAGVDEWAGELLRAQLPPVGSAGDSSLLPVLDERGVFHPERLEAVHRFFETSSRGLPSIPDEALTREAMYQDHD